MGPERIILVNSPITTFQQSLTHSAMKSDFPKLSPIVSGPLFGAIVYIKDILFIFIYP